MKFTFVYRQLFLFLFILIFKSNTNAQVTLPSGFSDKLVANGFNQIQGFVQDSIGRYYTWERGGRVIILDTNLTKLPTLIDIKEEVGSWGDHGLNAIALDPAFESNGYIYLFYTVDRHHLMNFGTANYNANTNQYYEATIARLTRYTCDEATNYTSIIPNSRLVLIGSNVTNGIPVLASNHSGGGLAFGSDGSLLVATGDAAVNGGDTGSFVGTYWQQAIADSILKPTNNVGAYRSQIVQSLNGKILRINPANGNGYQSNPFYNPNRPQSAISLVYALGFRNPFRISVKKGTGSTDVTAGDPGIIYIGDVGATKYEELNVCDASGQNFGWPLYEGFSTTTEFYGKNHTNLYAANPLYGQGCNQPYFTYMELLKQPIITGLPIFKNTCDTNISIPAELCFTHKRPLFDYKHTGNITRTETYIGNEAAEISISDVQAPITGNVFSGYCIIGGNWSYSNKLPVAYQNNYFFADYSDNWIKRITFNGNNAVEILPFASNIPTTVFITEGKSGCLEYINYTSEIRKICYDSVVNNPPVAKITASNNYGISGTSINFNGLACTDFENDSLIYNWNFGDGSQATGLHVSHVFTGSGVTNYWSKLTVTDIANNSSVDSVLVSINNTPPVVNITSIPLGTTFSAIQITPLNLVATVTDAEHNNQQLHYEWETILAHNFHQHPNLPDTDHITTTTLLPVGCDGDVYYYIIRLTVTDDGGLFTQTEQIINEICGNPIANFSATKTTACVNETISFINQSTNSVVSNEWTFTGGTPNTSTLANPTIAYNTPGTYEVKLKVTNPNGNDSIVKTGYITIKSLPTANISASGNTTFCEFGSVTLTSPHINTNQYQWLKGTKELAGKTAHNIIVNTSGNYKLKITDNYGCVGYSNSIKTKLSPEFEITTTGSLQICNNSYFTLSATNNSNFTYKWKKSGTNLPGEINHNFTTNIPGAYTVRVADNMTGCTKLSSVYNAVNNCNRVVDENIQLTLNNIIVYPIPVLNQLNIDYTLNFEGDVDLLVYDINGKLVSEKNNINILPNNYQQSINFSTFTAGIYNIKILYNKAEIKSIKVLKR
ncbi:MAG: PQQ-dependent sugar dehydrogenase [Bacteroidia bacterium]|nr:PQQ-dependent sugar dehydrogenase [Bacteroidia bacterium]